MEKLRKLWKDTFGDSDQYLNLVFGNYYDPRYCFGITHPANPQELIAGGVGIPYDFKDRESGHSFRGLYLCGLATRPEFRRRGLMESLIKEEEERAGADGFDFLFLIPADMHLREYYNKFGFHSSVTSRATLPVNDLLQISWERSDIDENPTERDFRENRLFEISSPSPHDFSILANGENLHPGIAIRHRELDFKVAAEECRQSGGMIFRFNTAIAFLDPREPLDSRPGESVTHERRIRTILFSRRADAIELLRLLTEKFPEERLTLQLDISHPLYNGILPEDAPQEPYGMMKWLKEPPTLENPPEFKICENPKIPTETPSNPKFSILAKTPPTAISLMLD